MLRLGLSETPDVIIFTEESYNCSSNTIIIYVHLRLSNLESVLPSKPVDLISTRLNTFKIEI